MPTSAGHCGHNGIFESRKARGELFQADLAGGEMVRHVPDEAGAKDEALSLAFKFLAQCGLVGWGRVECFRQGGSY